MSDIQAQLSVLKQTADAEVVNAIHRLIEDGEDHELNRVNVLDFSRQHNLDEERAISGFPAFGPARAVRSRLERAVSGVRRRAWRAFDPEGAQAR